MSKLCCPTFLLLSLLLQSCSGVVFPWQVPSSKASPTPGASPALATTIPSTLSSPEQDSTSTDAAVLRIWLPPQFNPTSERPEGKLLQERLQEFINRQPGMQLDIRVKAQDGPGGLLDTLASANAAAPSILPDLIALPRSILESAALKGLVYPLDSLSTTINNSDWYDYARQLARIQGSTFGLPFAGDAMLMTYHPSVIGDPPRDLNSALAEKGVLDFPAGDLDALYTLNLYQAAGGSIQDNQGRPMIDPVVLSQVLDFYQKAEKSGLIPPWLTLYQSDDQAWSAFNEQKAGMAITWASRYLKMAGKLPEDIAAAPLPTLNGAPYTLATGWVWALGNNKPGRQARAVELAEFLTQGEFLAGWTSAAGYLPPRSSALSAWPDTPVRSLASQVVLSAHLYPSEDVLSSLGTVLQASTDAALGQRGTPEQLAQDAADQLRNP